ncbi:MAG: hypothetical protein QXS93_01520 [Candidatus Micrarchaeia archaeon]
MPTHPYLSKGPTTALKEKSAEEKKRSFNKMKVLGALIISIPSIIGAWQTYQYASTNYPIWNASIYKINGEGKMKKVWDKGNVNNIKEFTQLLPGVLNTDNERLLEGLKGVIIQFHTEDRPEMIGGNYDSKNNIIHIYPDTTNGVLLHELLHHIYEKVLTDAERAEFNAFAKKVYSLAKKDTAELYDALKGGLTPEGIKYFERAYEISLRVEQYKNNFQSSQEFERFAASELFAAVFDFKDFGVAYPIKAIYENYLDESFVSQLVNQHTKDMF